MTCIGASLGQLRAEKSIKKIVFVTARRRWKNFTFFARAVSADAGGDNHGSIVNRECDATKVLEKTSFRNRKDAESAFPEAKNGKQLVFKACTQKDYKCKRVPGFLENSKSVLQKVHRGSSDYDSQIMYIKENWVGRLWEKGTDGITSSKRKSAKNVFCGMCSKKTLCVAKVRKLYG